ncbi:hypothetical protein SAMN02745121_01102 [Nannocystis exedens]|uniref:Thioredoxin n=1 Tax=Nannocystis exedens TaxID=54 RepID=A0A1I1UE10_9BACT|nr:hypothetical protein [Nannocystis exedens]PCC71557.1 hypothetical protein NAEX_04634 [Nannocystis exedens]SFD67848.1 hypothetical protein SAMN02745121_01102 [Nannocystis exedens]
MADPVRVSRAILFVALVCACTQPQARPPAAEVAPTVVPPPPETSAPAADPAHADRVRDLQAAFDPEQCLGEPEARLREHPNDARLLDAGFCQEAGIATFPTFWVLDREGRLAYDLRGAAGNLREEFAWRIESLRG